ncbi:MAG: TonB-dependent receptor [Elusimicrobiota bacterium]
MKVRKLSGIIVLCFVAVIAAGTVQEVFSSDAEMLLFQEIPSVITASKKAQKLTDAPANVLVVTAAEIKKKGYNNLIDVFRDVASIDINSPGMGYQLDMGMRGVNDRLTNVKHWQILLDGHDLVWRQFFRYYISPAWIALDCIERIEIVKGPGSALWGANAYLGVINIITKDADTEKNGSSVSITGGSFQTISQNVTVSRKISDDASVYATASGYSENIPRKVLEWSEIAGKDIVLKNNESVYYNFHSKMKYKSLKLTTHLDRDDSHKSMSSFSVGAEFSRFVSDRAYAILSLEKEVSDTMNAKVSAYYDYYAWGKGAQYEDNPYKGAFSDPTGTGHFIMHMIAVDNVGGFKAQLDYEASDKLSLVSGVDYEYRDIVRWYYPEVFDSLGLGAPKFLTWTYAAYLQGQYEVSDMVDVTVGGRYDNDSDYGGVTNPRVAVVLEPIENTYVKLLYGQAYKAPSLHELYYFRKNAYYGNPSVTPETNTTSEIQVMSKISERISGSINYFYIDMQDIIVYKSKAKGTALTGAESFPVSQRPTTAYYQQENVASLISSGVEAELTLTPVDNLRIALNGTVRNPIDADTEERLDYTTEVGVGGWIDYKISDKASVGVTTRYVGDKQLPARVTNEPSAPWQRTTDTTLEAPAYTSTNLIFNFNDIIESMSLTLKVENIFDQEYYDANREFLYGQPGRGIYLTTGYRF